MLIRELIMGYFLKPQEETCISMSRIVGYLFLLVGGGIGLYFLFQALIPLMGNIASGASISAILVAVGVFFLLYEKKKKPSHHLDNLFEEAQDIFKKIDIEKILKNNVHKVLLFSFLGGVILSQIKDKKKFAYVKDMLPHLKHLKDLLK